LSAESALIENNAVADGVRRHLRTHGYDFACGLVTGHDAHFRPRQFAGAMQHIMMTNAGDLDSDENILRTWLRRREIANLQGLWRAERFDDNGFH
jgi:hypothetical protein